MEFGATRKLLFRDSCAAQPERTQVLIGGLGAPYDDLLAVALRVAEPRFGRRVRTIGALDAEALRGGQEACGRGHCAPVLYTAGALLRTLREERHKGPTAFLFPSSCGPCRYAAFHDTWRRAFQSSGIEAPSFFGLEQSGESFASLLEQPLLAEMVDAVLAADILMEAWRRLSSYVVSLDALDRALANAVHSVSRAIAMRRSLPLALRRALAGFRKLPVADAMAPRARIAVIGDPWSLHVQGDGQLNLPHVLARARVETELPPVALWIEYLLWQAGSDFSLGPRLERMSEIAGLRGFRIPSVSRLGASAEPYLPSYQRGGYGHVEVGLAVRVVEERRAHAIVSVKSFGCIPSVGVSDAIVPSVLDARVPFLSLEVSGDGDATKESRLALRVDQARTKSESEFETAKSMSTGAALASWVHPFDEDHQSPWRYACAAARRVAMHRIDTKIEGAERC